MILFFICFILFGCPLTASAIVTFRIHQQNKTWEAAQTFCRNYGDSYDLARIDNIVENAWVVGLLQNQVGSYKGGLWLAGVRNEGNRYLWEWRTRFGRSPFIYTSWANAQPDDFGFGVGFGLCDDYPECGEIYAEMRNFSYGYLWNDYEFEEEEFFICECRDKLCCSSWL